MFFFILLIFVILVSNSSFRDVTNRSEYLDRNNTSTINGFFVLLIFLSHSTSYIVCDNAIDSLYVSFQRFMGQLVVTTFLFFSGYGMTLKICDSGYEYVKAIICKKLPQLWIRFAVAVCLFLLLDIAIGDIPPIRRFVISLVGWESIGNSNWYICDFFVLYILMFISFCVLKIRDTMLIKIVGAVIMTILTILWMWILLKVGKNEVFYNTLPCFVFGMWYAFFHKRIEKMILYDELIYSISTLLVTMIFAFTSIYAVQENVILPGINYVVREASFVGLIILICMRIRINSRLLNWFGIHIFTIYILQRLPMIFMDQYGVGDRHPYWFVIISIVATVTMALIYDKLCKHVDSKEISFESLILKR